MLLVLLLNACASTSLREQFTAAEQQIAAVPGMPAVRIWADAPPRVVRAELNERADAAYQLAAYGIDDIKVLSISGGACLRTIISAPGPIFSHRVHMSRRGRIKVGERATFLNNT